MSVTSNSGIVIFGSSRSKGNTYEVSKAIADQTEFDVVDLNTLDISAYDYAHGNRNDDFLALAADMANKKVIVLVSPVYWYAMSAQMKTFIDRWSDLVTIRKDLGRQLKDVRLVVVSCSGDKNPGDGFELPFSQTAGYLSMNYQGHYHVWKEDNTDLSDEVKEIINSLSQQLDKIIKEN